MKKGLVAVLAGLAATGAVSFAAPVNAYPGGCYTDDFGRCRFAPLELWAPAQSPIDMAAWGSNPDQHFAYWLTHSDDVPNFMIYNFDVVKAQGLQACGLRSRGVRQRDAIAYVQSLTSDYSRDEAANIVISAAVAYCDWVIDRNPQPSYPVA